MSREVHIYLLVVCVSMYLNLCGCLQAKSCNDCIPISKCKAALDLLTKNSTNNRQQLMNAFCGFNQNTKQAQVCCSQLISVDIRNLDTHSNVKLLPTKCGLIDEDRVYGGEEAGLNEFPWMTLISYKTRVGLEFKCGGTVINERYILTAAHCIVGQKIAGVRVGDHNVNTETDCQGKVPKIICASPYQDIQVEEEIPHNGYKKAISSIINDIGLLRLLTPIDFSYQNAGAICLPLTAGLRNKNVGGLNGTVAGWGYTESGYVSEVLLSASVPVYTKERCSSVYNKGNEGTDQTKNKLCAGENGKDSCRGDSGGPLMIASVNRYIQHGIVSYGPKSCGLGTPGVYTDITKYMDWILDNIRP